MSAYMENKIIKWNIEKNELLKHDRGVSFELIESLIEEGKILDIIENKNYPNQRVFLFNLDNYIISVPFVENNEEIFLKTIFRTRKLNKQYKDNKK